MTSSKNKFVILILLSTSIISSLSAQGAKEDLIVTARILIQEANKNIDKLTCESLSTALDLYNAYEVFADGYPNIFNSLERKISNLEITMAKLGCKSFGTEGSRGSFTTFKYKSNKSSPSPGIDVAIPISVLAGYFMSSEQRINYFQSLDEENKYEYVSWTQKNIELNGSLLGYVKSEFGTDNLISDQKLEVTLSAIDLNRFNISPQDWKAIQDQIKTELIIKKQ